MKTCPTCSQTIPLDRLEGAGALAVERALTDWKSDVFDPKPKDVSDDARRCKTIIGTMIRVGLGWTWEPPIYEGDGTFEWCGAAVASWWPTVKTELRKTYFSSTYRLDRYASYQSALGEVNKGTGRLYARLDENSKTLPFEPRPGDILTIGPAGSGYGKHICLVEHYDADNQVFHTIEGNGSGRGPNGERQHGVVRSIRPLGHAWQWHARRLIRPSVDDLL
jgi:hypothetical protein